MNRQAGRIKWEHEMRGSNIQPEEKEDKEKEKEKREDHETCEYLSKVQG